MTATKSMNGARGSAAKKRTNKTQPDLLGRFGPYLMLRRKRKNLSIRGFAKRAGVPHTNVYQFERLRKDPRLTELAQLAQAFREPLAKFLEPLL
jgi:ribosome-binding protein aMBF1 (putative translation factor)